VKVVPDPIRGAPHVLIMCEVFSPDGTAHPSNTRAKLREVCTKAVLAEDPWFGFEQEYTMLQKGTGKVYGWPATGYPHPQVRVSCVRTSARVPACSRARTWVGACAHAYGPLGMRPMRRMPETPAHRTPPMSLRDVRASSDYVMP
jgi:glutamine synthetase